MTRFLACALLLVLPLLTDRSGQNVYLSDTRGTVDVAVLRGNTALHGLGAADAATFFRRLEQLRAALLAQPVFNPPTGVRIGGDFRLDIARQDIPRAPVPAVGRLRFYPSLVGKNGQPGFIIATTDEMVVFVNHPTGDLEAGRVGSAKFLHEPKRAGEIDGFPIFRGELDCEYVLITRTGAVPWIPVTREELARESLEFWQGVERDSPQGGMPARAIARHQAVLAAMSVEERGMQARISQQSPDGLGPPLPPVGSQDGIPLVKPNPAWFDPALPRTAIQMLLVKFWYSGSLDPDHPGPEPGGSVGPLRVWEALHHSNWKAISAVLDAGTTPARNSK
jgi:hypothetical protein